MHTAEGRQTRPAGTTARLVITLALCAVTIGCGSARLLPGRLDFVGNIWPDGVDSDPYFLDYWNQVTVENGGKWGNVESVRDEMRWADLDLAYNFAKENDLRFRLHTLVWGRSQPPWLGPLPADELREEVNEWFTLVGERYPDVDMIDVVNEPLHIQPAYMDALGGAGETRWDWIITCFELARMHFPDAALGVNEFGILRSESSATAYLRLIRVLKDRDLIDYIGVQAHNLQGVSSDVISASLDLLARERLPIYVTELDLGIADDQAQADRMEELITLFAANRHVRGVTFWGYRERMIYLKPAYLLGTDGTERPALTWLAEFAVKRANLK